MKSLLRTLGASIAVFALFTFAAGCSSSDPKPEPTISDGNSTTSAYDAKAVPERPADVNSSEGADSFAQYAASVLFYTWATGDATVLRSISDPTTCNVCQRWSNLASTGGIEYLSVAETKPQFSLAAGPTMDDGGFYGITYSVAPISFTVFNNQTGEEASPTTQDNMTVLADVRWDSDHWVLQSISIPSES